MMHLIIAVRIMLFSKYLFASTDEVGVTGAASLVKCCALASGSQDVEIGRSRCRCQCRRSKCNKKTTLWVKKVIPPAADKMLMMICWARFKIGSKRIYKMRRRHLALNSATLFQQDIF